ncbi:hypothetical protein [Streptococcus gallolyticus]|uniref:hypothetical protein n=1 Tax=Streptococcus gallolyticus TaxID=315405 RepID=UPI00228531BC|nr:hypothetical protein [Streptococcus gallolyticus]MCY7187303.1 hypothetical protein [Streptococcus gallolyticus subsp. gallolyticus]
MRKRKSGLRTIQFYAAVIAENIPSEGMEFYLYNNGESGMRTIGTLSDKESEIVYTTSLSESYWGTIIEDDYPGIDLNNKERTEIERDIIIRFTKEDLSYAVDRKTGNPLFQ